MENIQDFLKVLGYFTIGSVSITGATSYLLNKLFEHKLAKLNQENQIRFSRIYNDRADQWRKTYKNLVIAERNIEELLRPVKFNPRPKEEVQKDTIISIQELFNDFDENKLFFEEETIIIMEELRTQFMRSWGNHFKIEFLRDLKGTDVFAEAVVDANETYELVIKETIPNLKDILRQDIRRNLGLEEHPTIRKKKQCV